MKSRKPKWLVLLITAVMMLTIMPATASAQGDEICVAYDENDEEIGKFSDLNEATVRAAEYNKATIKLLDDVEVKCGENTYFYSLGLSDEDLDRMLGIEGIHSVLGIMSMGNVTYDLNGCTLTFLPSDSADELTLPDYMSAYEGIHGWGFTSIDHAGDINVKNGTILLGENVLGMLSMYDVNLDTVSMEASQGVEAYGVGMRGSGEIHLIQSKIKTGGEGKSIVEDKRSVDVILDEKSALDFLPGQNSIIKTKDTDGNPVQLTANQSGEFVIPVDVTGIVLQETELSLCPGREFALVAEISPEEATDQTIQWQSSDSGVVTVDTNGKIKAIQEGQVKITATAGNFSATCAVTVGHTPGAEWKSDQTNHWKECTVCAVKTEEAVHTFAWITDKEATPTQAGSKHEECLVCGYKKAGIEIPATGTTEPSGNPDTGTTDKPTSTGGSQTNSVGSPQTGDTSNIALWIAVMFATGTAFTSAVLYRRKRTSSRSTRSGCGQ